MVKQKNIETLFSNLAKDFTDSIIAIPDDEIIEEAKEFHKHPLEKANLMRSQFSSLIMSCRKERNLVSAQHDLKVEMKNKPITDKIASWPIQKLKDFLDDTFNSDNSIPDNIIVAFRKKDNLSKDDLIHLVENLYDLGLIDEEEC